MRIKIQDPANTAARIKKDFPLRNMKKKAFLFTIMTLVILMPILMIAMIHYESEEREAINTNKLMFAKRINYIMDDLSFDIKTINNYSFYFENNNNSSQIHIENLSLTDRTPINTNLSIFFNGLYSNITNQHLNVNLTNIIYIYKDYQLFLTFNLSNKTLEISGLSDISSIDIVVRSKQIGTLNTTGSPSSAGSTPIRVRIEDYYTNSQLDQTRNLDISSANNPFFARENANYINVTVSSNKIIIISNMTLELKSLKINLTNASVLTANTGEITINEFLGLMKTGTFRIG